MDTTKENIKMCARAKEVQEAWKPDIGDYFSNAQGTGCVSEVGYVAKELDIWLPKQDQLQEMVEYRLYQIQFGWLASSYMFYGYPGTYRNAIQGSSMEQLWLAFVMKEKYGKEWNGEDWV